MAQVPDKATSLSILERMLVMRRFEERVFPLAEQKLVTGIFHLYIGQEGTGAAVLEVAGEKDHILSTHRNHGHVVGRGTELGKAFAEMMGRVDGLQGGRGGTFHLSDASRGMLQTSAIVGGCPALTVGAAYGIKQSGGGRVAIGFFGDSALEEGVAYEAFNLAALWKLPAVLVCENNSIGVGEMKGDSYPRSMLCSERLSRIAEMVGVHCIQVGNGCNAAEVYAAAVAAREHCLAGKGPVFIESPIIRWPGGQALFPKPIGDTDLELAFGAEAEGEHKVWKEQHDPLIRWIREVVAAGYATKDEVLARDRAVLERVEEGVRYASASPFPDPATATEKVFA